MNRVLIVGRLTKDVETKQTESGKTLCFFSVAVNQKSGVDYFDISSFDYTAAYLGKYGKKGDVISVEAHLSSYEVEKDGVKTKTLRINCHACHLFSMGRRIGMDECDELDEEYERNLNKAIEELTNC